MKADPTSTPIPADPYVERNLSTKVLLDWAMASHPNPTRMRSIVGPPGVGKTTFLRQLREALRQQDAAVLWLDLSIVHEGLARRPWAENEAVWSRYLQAEDAKRAAASVEEFIAIAASASSQGMAPVLLADGYDELEPAERQWVEQHILIPFLFPNEVANPQSRVVLARRDEYALSAARLRWEDMALTLEGLTDPAAQLWALLRADPAAVGATMVVPAAVIAAITALDDDDDARAALVAALQAMLTPNPFVNLHLLERHFQHPAISLGPDDCQHCLAMYVERAGLSRDYVEVLVRRAQQYRAGQFDISQYDDKKELGVLVGAGVISHVPDSPRFQLEAAVVHLVAHMPAPAQPQGN